jgi:hypothetical protein
LILFFEFYKELNQKPNQKDTPNLPEPEVQETKQINELTIYQG